MSLITLYENIIKEYIESNKLAKDITKKTLLQIYIFLCFHFSFFSLTLPYHLQACQ